MSRSTNFLIGGTTVKAAANAIGKASIHDRSRGAQKFAGKPRLISVSANDIKNDIVSATKKTNKTGAYFFGICAFIRGFSLSGISIFRVSLTTAILRRGERICP